MITLADGPLAGRHRLALHRLPIYLRFVVDHEGKVDALNELEDKAATNETIHAYIKVSDDGSVHINSRDRKTGKHNGGFFRIATYKYVAEMTDDATMRSNNLWQAWCVKTFAARSRPQE